MDLLKVECDGSNSKETGVQTLYNHGTTILSMDRTHTEVQKQVLLNRCIGHVSSMISKNIHQSTYLHSNR